MTTYVAACWPFQSSSLGHIGPVCSEAQTSSTPPESRTRVRSRLICRHRIVFVDRRRRLGLLWRSRARRAWCGVRLWRRWRGWGGGRHCEFLLELVLFLWVWFASGSLELDWNCFQDMWENDRTGSETYTTICLRPRRGFRMNLRVRRVTCESAMLKKPRCPILWARESG